MAGVALGNIHVAFAGRCGTYGTELAPVVRLARRDAALFCMALGDIHADFVWHAWHLVTSTVFLHGRCGSYGTELALVTLCLIL